jgi:hypothetical protein
MTTKIEYKMTDDVIGGVMTATLEGIKYYFI